MLARRGAMLPKEEAPALSDDRRQCETSLAAFLRRSWPVLRPNEPLQWDIALEALCVHLEALRAGRLRNIYAATPPGTLKSHTINVAFPAWCWATEPSLQFLHGTCSDDNAVRDSLNCRRLIESDWYQERWGDRFSLASDQNEKDWYNTSAGGHRIITTTKSDVVGKKADILLGDDLHDITTVESKTMRDRAKYWFRNSFWNRVNNFRTGRRFVAGQRCHIEDVYADLIAMDWTLLLLPEEFEPRRACATPVWSDPRTREGEWLRPDRFAEPEKADSFKTLGARGYAAQHQQNPRPAEGNHYKAEWFAPRYVAGPDYYQLPASRGGRLWHLPQLTIFAVCDPAGGVSEASSCTAIGVYATTPDNNLLVLYSFSEHIGIDAIVPTLKWVCDAWRPSYVLFEGEFLYRQYAERAQEVRGMPAVKIVTTGGKDKLARATPAIYRAQAGQIILPADGPGFEWVSGWLEEHLAFTGRKDEENGACDCTSWAALELQDEALARAASPESLFSFGGYTPLAERQA